MGPEAGGKERPAARFPAVPDGLRARTGRAPASGRAHRACRVRAPGRWRPPAPLRPSGPTELPALSPEGLAQHRWSRRGLKLILHAGSVRVFFRGDYPPTPPFPNQGRPRCLTVSVVPAASDHPGPYWPVPTLRPPSRAPRCLGVPIPSRFCVVRGLPPPKTFARAGAKRKLGVGEAAAGRRAPSRGG